MLQDAGEYVFNKLRQGFGISFAVCITLSVWFEIDWQAFLIMLIVIGLVSSWLVFRIDLAIAKINRRMLAEREIVRNNGHRREVKFYARGKKRGYVYVDEPDDE